MRTPEMTDMQWRLSWLWNSAFWYGLELARKQHKSGAEIEHTPFMRRILAAKRRHIKKGFNENVAGQYAFWHKLERE